MINVSPTAPASGLTITRDNYAFLQDELRRLSGIVLDDGKRYLVEARLAPLAAQLGLSGLDQLAAALRRNPGGLRRQFVEAMTTHETYFFREPRLWEALRDHVLPEIIFRRSAARRLRCWSAAASSGQEAYTLAMLLSECRLDGWDIQIRATDISAAVLETARLGRYSQTQVSRGLPACYLLRHFVRDRLDWVVADRIRAMVRFEQADLRDHESGAEAHDLVLCRNVLIYFDLPTKRTVVGGLRRSLAPEGYLALGAAENLLGVADDLQTVACGSAVLYRANGKTNG